MADESSFWTQDHIVILLFAGFLVVALIGVLGPSSSLSSSMPKPIPISFKSSGGITGYSVAPVGSFSSCESISDCPSYCIDGNTVSQASGCYLGFCIYSAEPCGRGCYSGACQVRSSPSRKAFCGDDICQIGENCQADCGGVAGVTKARCEAYGSFWSDCDDGSCATSFCSCGPASDYSCPTGTQCVLRAGKAYGVCLA